MPILKKKKCIHNVISSNISIFHYYQDHYISKNNILKRPKLQQHLQHKGHLYYKTIMFQLVAFARVFIGQIYYDKIQIGEY